MINSVEETRGCFKEEKVFKGQEEVLSVTMAGIPCTAGRNTFPSELPGKPSNGNGRKM